MSTVTTSASVVLGRAGGVACLCADGDGRLVVFGRPAAAPWPDADAAQAWLDRRARDPWHPIGGALARHHSGALMLCANVPLRRGPAVTAMLVEGDTARLMQDVVVPGLRQHLDRDATPPTRALAVPTPESADRLAHLVCRYRGRVALYTGAGLSVDSGVPALEGERGLLRRTGLLDDDPLAVPRRMLDHPDALLDLCGVLDEQRHGGAPSDAHEAIAELVRGGTVSTIWSSNVDGLHEQTGFQPRHPEDASALRTDRPALLVTVGVSRDEYGLLRHALDAAVTVACIDPVASDAARLAHLWISADAQAVLPMIARALC